MKYFNILVASLIAIVTYSQTDSIQSKTQLLYGEKYYVFEDKNWSTHKLANNCLGQMRSQRIVEMIKESFTENTIESLKINLWGISVVYKNDTIVSCSIRFTDISSINKDNINNLFKKLKSEKVVRCIDGPTEGLQFYGIDGRGLLNGRANVKEDEWY